MRRQLHNNTSVFQISNHDTAKKTEEKKALPLKLAHFLFLSPSYMTLHLFVNN